MYVIENHLLFLGDCMTNFANDQMFSTFDHDNNRNAGSCALAFHGAWWYKNCHCSNLNGGYLAGHHSSHADGINWYTWHGDFYSLKTTDMMIRKYGN